jgi:predicted NAD/FAD-dependent oxidoreductase
VPEQESSKAKVVKGKSPDCPVAVIGAGPYGLSSAAYLRGEGHRNAGFWRTDGILAKPDAGRHSRRLPHCEHGAYLDLGRPGAGTNDRN